MFSTRVWGAVRRALPVLSALAALCVAAPSSAQDYPSKPVRLVVAFPAGGTADAVGRVLADALSQKIGVTIVVDNQGGATGAIGAGQVARAEPDGYTLLLGANSIFAVIPHLRELEFDPNADLLAVAKLADSRRLLAVHPDVPAKTVEEFIAYAKANPGTLNYGSPGNASTPQILTEVFKAEAGIDVLHIPYGGSGPALNGLLSGTVQMMIDTVVIAPAEEGTLRGLAVFGQSRLPGLPDVPTFSELGFSKMSSGGWTGLFAPAGTPDAIVQMLSSSIEELYGDQAFVDRLASLGVEPDYQPAGEFAASIKADFDYFGSVIEAAGITTE